MKHFLTSVVLLLIVLTLSVGCSQRTESNGYRYETEKYHYLLTFQNGKANFVVTADGNSCEYSGILTEQDVNVYLIEMIDFGIGTPFPSDNFYIIISNDTFMFYDYTGRTVVPTDDSYKENGQSNDKPNDDDNSVPDDNDDFQIDECKHVNTEVRNLKEATCVSDGYSGDIVCIDCDKTIQVGVVVSAFGHKETLKNVKAPTCVEEGYSGDKYCEICLTLIKKGVPVSALGHKSKVINRKEPTCEETGYSGDEVCDVCEELLSSGEEILPLGHKSSELLLVKDPTCTEDGFTGKRLCVREGCNALLEAGKVIPRLGHSEKVVGAADATCVKDGYSGDVVCERCDLTLESGKTIPKFNHNKTEIRYAVESNCTQDGYSGDEVCLLCGALVANGEIIPSSGHVLSEKYGVKAATCIETGYTGDRCCEKCDYVEYGEVTPKSDHNCVLEKEKAATCEVSGYSGDYVCKVCRTKVSEGEIIPKLGHSEEDIEPIEPTCEECGYTAGTKCSRCEKVINEPKTIEKLGHVEIIENVKYATCEENGYTGDVICKVCDKVVKKGVVTSKLGHNVVEVPDKEATCEDDGYEGEKYCERCNTVFSKRKVIAATGHDYKLINNKEATCVEDGYTGDLECSRCGDVKHTGSVVLKTGHDSEIVGEKDASCVESGYTGDVRCKKCELILQKGQIVPSKGHKLVYCNAVDATCTADGKEADVRCERCDFYKEGKVIERIGHEVVRHRCQSCDELFITGKYSMTSISEYEIIVDEFEREIKEEFLLEILSDSAKIVKTVYLKQIEYFAYHAQDEQIYSIDFYRDGVEDWYEIPSDFEQQSFENNVRIYKRSVATEYGNGNEILQINESGFGTLALEVYASEIIVDGTYAFSNPTISIQGKEYDLDFETDTFDDRAEDDVTVSFFVNGTLRSKKSYSISAIEQAGFDGITRWYVDEELTEEFDASAFDGAKSLNLYARKEYGNTFVFNEKPYLYSYEDYDGVTSGDALFTNLASSENTEYVGENFAVIFRENGLTPTEALIPQNRYELIKDHVIEVSVEPLTDHATICVDFNGKKTITFLPEEEVLAQEYLSDLLATLGINGAELNEYDYGYENDGKDYKSSIEENAKTYNYYDNGKLTVYKRRHKISVVYNVNGQEVYREIDFGEEYTVESFVGYDFERFYYYNESDEVNALSVGARINPTCDIRFYVYKLTVAIPNSETIILCDFDKGISVITDTPVGYSFEYFSVNGIVYNVSTINCVLHELLSELYIQDSQEIVIMSRFVKSIKINPTEEANGKTEVTCIVGNETLTNVTSIPRLCDENYTLSVTEPSLFADGIKIYQSEEYGSYEIIIPKLTRKEFIYDGNRYVMDLTVGSLSINGKEYKTDFVISDDGKIVCKGQSERTYTYTLEIVSGFYAVLSDAPLDANIDVEAIDTGSNQTYYNISEVLYENATLTHDGENYLLLDENGETITRYGALEYDEEGGRFVSVGDFGSTCYTLGLYMSVDGSYYIVEMEEGSGAMEKGLSMNPWDEPITVGSVRRADTDNVISVSGSNYTYGTETGNLYKDKTKKICYMGIGEAIFEFIYTVVDGKDVMTANG